MKRYYSIQVWEDKNNWGSTIKNKYKTLGGAFKKLLALAGSGMYESIMIRKEEIYVDTAKACISISSPIKCWEAGRIVNYGN